MIHKSVGNGSFGLGAHQSHIKSYESHDKTSEASWQSHQGDGRPNRKARRAQARESRRDKATRFRGEIGQLLLGWLFMQEAYLSKKLSTDPPRWDQHVRQKAAILRSWADESGDTAMHREAEQWERNAATVDRVMAKLEAIAPGQCPWNRAGGAS